jgi:hypothetical protein
MLYTGADPGFQVREGAHLKKLRRAEGGANIFGVFRVKNHDFTPKNNIFSNFKEWRDTRTFSNLKSTNCTLLILLIINLVTK